MGLNLIQDAWLPVLRKTGCDVIRLDQIAEPDILGPNWPRADFDLATYELLIGLVYIACPPSDRRDWRAGFEVPPDLATAFARLAPAFDLVGEGPCFLQDLDTTFGGDKSEMRKSSCLMIDKAADSAIKANKDVLAHRERYRQGLDWPTAAIALWTLQSQAPKGGSGNRTSLRGGGPLVTLVDPGAGRLWDTIWANVPEGAPIADLTELPWMRPTVTSRKGEEVVPDRDPSAPPAAEVFFSMPRRIRLHGLQRLEVVQTVPSGTNYTGWRHPLTPYYAAPDGPLPVHAHSLKFSYRNWSGVILAKNGGARAMALDRYLAERRRAPARLIIGGWVMGDASPISFLRVDQPVFPLDAQGEALANRLIDATHSVGYVLASCLRSALEAEVWGQGAKEADGRAAGLGAAAYDRLHEITQSSFETSLSRLTSNPDVEAEVMDAWRDMLVETSRRMFDAEIEPRLARLSVSRRRAAIRARNRLLAVLRGQGTYGAKFHEALGLPIPTPNAKGQPDEAS